jgi:hypothetical protein
MSLNQGTLGWHHLGCQELYTLLLLVRQGKQALGTLVLNPFALRMGKHHIAAGWIYSPQLVRHMLIAHRRGGMFPKQLPTGSCFNSELKQAR